MADGRYTAKLVSPGIGCTAFTNTTGKAISASFFAQGISTNTNSKATVVIAGAGMTITQNSILWQPSLCIACYSGFIAAGSTVGSTVGWTNVCCAYPDPVKMGQAYTCGIFKSNVGTGRSGTPGYTCGLPRCFCGRSWYRCNSGSYCYPTCWRHFNYCSCFNIQGGGCITCTGGLYCCYELHYKCLNCCETGGVRFPRPHHIFVGIGTTFTGYCNPIPNTPSSLNCTQIGLHTKNYIGTNCCCGGEPNKEPSGPGKMTPWYLQCFHLSVAGVRDGLDCYSSKCGYEMGCFVPAHYGGTEVINPAIALTNPPLYNGTYSGFPESNGSCHCCVCYSGPMWQTLITGWFPSDEQNCYDWCCAYFYDGNASCCNVSQQRQQSSLDPSGTWGVGYLLTACHTPNVIDAAKRLIAPKDDAGVGAGMTGIPFCYCNNQPAFNNTQGGNPLCMQVACNRFGTCLCINGFQWAICQCNSQNTPLFSSGLQGNYLVDWYALTDYQNWCHCQDCVGRLTKRGSNTISEPGCYQCNPVNNNCWCCEVMMCLTHGCSHGHACPCASGSDTDSTIKKRLLPIIISGNWRGLMGVMPCICIAPGSSACGLIKYCVDCCVIACRYQNYGYGYTYDSNSHRCEASGYERAWTFHLGQPFKSGQCECCNSWIYGSNQCCHACGCWYCNCCCGPCIGAPYNKPMGCCGFMLPIYCDSQGNQCKCWNGYSSMTYHVTPHNPHNNGSGVPANPYGYHHGISCGLIMHWAGDGAYMIMPAALDWMNSYCYNGVCSQYCKKSRRPIFIHASGPNRCNYNCGGCACWERAVDRYIYCDANVCGGYSNYWFTQCSADADQLAVLCAKYDAAGALTCCIVTEDGHPFCTWACSSNVNCRWGSELPVKYFAYNPQLDCHYFMIRTAQAYMNLNWPCFCKQWVVETKTQAELDCCFVRGMKQCLFTREYCCGIFSVDCMAVMCYHQMAPSCQCAMCYDGGLKHPEYAAYCCWANEWCTGRTEQIGGCLCCICEIPNYRSQPCNGDQYAVCQHDWDYSFTLEPQGGCYRNETGTYNSDGYCRGPAGLGTMFFRKVANFPSIMTDYKYTQPRMCVGCLFRSDNQLWSLPVYNHCCFRWDTFITCDLINWNKQELEIVCKPGDQMNSPNFCQILSLENNYYCKCTDCFMSGFDRSGLLELCLTFNQYERTGIVISNNESVYVKSHNTTDCFNFQIWGYEG